MSARGITNLCTYRTWASTKKLEPDVQWYLHIYIVFDCGINI